MMDGSDSSEEIRALHFIKKALFRKNEKIAQITKKFNGLQQQYESLKGKFLIQEARLKAFKEVCQIKGFDIDLPEDDEIIIPVQSDFENEPTALSYNENVGFPILQSSENESPSGCQILHRRKNVPVKKSMKAVIKKEEPDFSSFELGVTSYDAEDGDDNEDDESDNEPLSKRARLSLKRKVSKHVIGIPKLRPALVSEIMKEKERKSRQQNVNSENSQGSVITTPDSEVTVIESISTMQGKDVILAPHILCDGYRYRATQFKNLGDRIYWICSHTRKVKCRSRVVTDKNYKILWAKNVHCHPPDFVKMLVDEAVSRIRKTIYKTAGTELSPQDVYDREHALAKEKCVERGYSLEEFAEKMPTVRELRFMIMRCRRNVKKLLSHQMGECNIDFEGHHNIVGSASEGGYDNGGGERFQEQSNLLNTDGAMEDRQHQHDAKGEPPRGEAVSLGGADPWTSPKAALAAAFVQHQQQNPL